MATPIPANRAPLSTFAAAAATGGTIARIGSEEGARAVGITTDSRAVTRGSAFVALRGATHDGHAFLGDAVAKGASLLIVDRQHEGVLPEVDVVVVEDTLVAWGDLARAHLRAWRRIHRGEARVVGITGSAGKTTTKEICATLLSTIAFCHRTAGNLNNRIGMPAVIFGLDADHRFAVLEMGMNLPGEIAALASIAEPDVAVVVNAGIAHAEGVGGTRADVAREKGAIYAALGREGVAVVNRDDAAASAQLARSQCMHDASFGRASDARYRLVDRRVHSSPRAESGSHLVIARGGERLEIDFPLVGEAAAIDFLAALAAAEAAASSTFTAPMIREALAQLPQPEGRAALRTLADGTLILDDSYNANPASMRAALTTLAELARSPAGNRRSVAIVGEMKELGASSLAEHEAIGDALVAAGIGYVIGCGGMADAIVDRAAAARIAHLKARDAADAAKLACAHVRPGDAVLVKGSRSVRTELVVDALVKSRGLAPSSGKAR